MQLFKNIITALTLFGVLAGAAPLALASGSSSSGHWLNSAESLSHLEIVSLEREPLFDDLALYTLVLKVGEGEFDTISVHRAVREESEWHPIKTDDAAFLLHGDLSHFESAFLLSADSANIPQEQSLAAFLAGNDVDVWGISYRWTHIPDTQTDFDFLQNWDTNLFLNDISIAVKIARLIRFGEGNGWHKLSLMGWSRGAQFAWAYVERETEKPSFLRDIDGLIPIDMAYKMAPADAALRVNACTRHANLLTARQNGTYHSNTGQVAQTFPDPVLLFLAANTYVATTPPLTPWYHWHAPLIVGGGLAGLKYTNFNHLKDFVSEMPFFQDNATSLDMEAIRCGLANPYDDNLGDITVPILNVAAAGGWGKVSLHTPTLTGSTDVANLLVQFEADGAELLDFGHADMMLAGNADSAWWSEALSWLQSH